LALEDEPSIGEHMKYFVKMWWETSGKTTYLIEENYKSNAERKAESMRKELVSKLKELGRDGTYSDVHFTVEQIDSELK
jgi:hypothetical protein